MADQTTYLEVTVPDPNAVNKALRTADGLEQLSKALSYVYTLTVTGLTVPYTIPYSASPGGTKTGLHFGVLKLTGTQAGAYSVIVPAKMHLFVIDNQSDQAATVRVTGQPGVTVAAGARKLVYCDGTDVVGPIG